jgi:glutamine synthetase
MTIDQVVHRAQEAGVKLVRFLYCDNSGIIRGKATTMSVLASRMADGVGLPTAMLAMNILDQQQVIQGLGSTGELRLIPDPESFVVLPYVPQSGALICDLYSIDQRPSPLCARNFLKRMRDRLADHDLTMRAAFEPEFSLARRDENGDYVPFDETLGLASTAMTQVANVATNLVVALESQGITVEHCSPEFGYGQHEMSIRHTDVLRAADNQIKVRETIRGVALQHSLFASLAPRPFLNQTGNGAHLHVSLWDDAGRNLFFDRTTPHGLSLLARQFIAGVLCHLPALAGLTCPSVNSYRRLRPKAWCGVHTAWGIDNRETAVRVPSTYWSDIEGSTNIELKTCDNSCNPYLALGAFIAAGLDGIERGLDPGPPTADDPAMLSEDDRHERGVRRLPSVLDRALDYLEDNRLLIEALGEPLAHAYLAVRRSEVSFFAAQNDSYEILQHFHKF